MKQSIRTKVTKTLVAIIVITMIISFLITEAGLIVLRHRSENLLLEQAISSADSFSTDQAELIDDQIHSLVDSIEEAAKFTEYIYENPSLIQSNHVKLPSEFPEDATGMNFSWAGFTEEDDTDPAVVKEVDSLSALEGYFSAMVEQNPMIISLYAATKSRINIGYDESVTQKVGVHFNPEEYGKEWYLRPLDDGLSYVSDTYPDMFGRGLTITISAPFFVNGEPYGVIGADVIIENINNTILDIDTGTDESYALLLDSKGGLIACKDMTENTTAEDVLGENNADILENISNETNGTILTTIDNKEVYLSFSRIESTDWTLVIVLPVDSIVAPAKESNKLILIINAILLLVNAIILIVMINVSKKKTRVITEPIVKLAGDIENVTGDQLNYESDIHTDDEIELLSHKFESATRRMREYIDNITTITAEKERVSAELDVAKHIQSSMLPCIFPPYPDRKEFDIYATMTPAKEVGGDFYDFFMVDDSHIAIVMADVSGKGVPAALFMVIGKTLIKDHTTPGRNLEDVFYEVNNMLCESNSEGMFITAFEGVLDLVTGDFIYVNAGHELPFVCQPGEEFSVHQMKAGFVLAGMEDMKFKGGVINLAPGAKLFTYTDGVPEATNADNELYGMDRLSKKLKELSKEEPENILNGIHESVNEFVGDAPQFDDITMLCIVYKEKMEK